MARLSVIQGLRALAASLVVTSHALQFPVQRHTLAPAWGVAAEALGQIGVAVFFIISGFIMVRTAGDEFARPGAPHRFLWRRILRIVPFYWPLSAVAIIQSWRLYGDVDPVEIATSFAFIPHLDRQGAMSPILGIGWTLNYEMAFYALFAAALMLPRRVGLTALFGVLCGLAAFGFLAHPGLHKPQTLIETWTSPIILLFGIGVALGLLERKARFLPKVELPVLSRLGDASYATYLWHAFTLPVAALAFRWMPPALFVVAAVLTSNLAGWVAYRTLEEPLMKWLSARRARRSERELEVWGDEEFARSARSVQAASTSWTTDPNSSTTAAMSNR